MPKKVITIYNGVQASGTSLDFEAEKESWAIYSMEDGSTLKMRTIVAEIIRVDGEFNQAGEPIYTVKSTAILNVEVPGNLKLGKKTKGKH